MVDWLIFLRRNICKCALDLPERRPMLTTFSPHCVRRFLYHGSSDPLRASHFWQSAQGAQRKRVTAWETKWVSRRSVQLVPWHQQSVLSTSFHSFSCLTFIDTSSWSAFKMARPAFIVRIAFSIFFVLSGSEMLPRRASKASIPILTARMRFRESMSSEIIAKQIVLQRL